MQLNHPCQSNGLRAFDIIIGGQEEQRDVKRYLARKPGLEGSYEAWERRNTKAVFCNSFSCDYRSPKCEEQ